MGSLSAALSSSRSKPAHPMIHGRILRPVLSVLSWTHVEYAVYVPDVQRLSAVNTVKQNHSQHLPNVYGRKNTEANPPSELLFRSMCDAGTGRRPRVGFWWTEKKSREFSAEDFAKACSAYGLEAVKLDLERPFEEQGPIAAIVHKSCHILVQADQGNAECQRITSEFEKYCCTHPEVLVLDPLENVRKVLNRFHQYQLVEKSKLSDTDWAFIPPFVELKSGDTEDILKRLNSRSITFPIVCKPIVSHGMKKAHQMCLVFGERGLSDIPVPCVAQQFVVHDARLLKVYVLGPQYHLTWRPSLRNFSAGNDSTIFFNSQEVSKPHSSSPLIDEATTSEAPPATPCSWQLRFLVDVIREELGQQLFGIDIIVEKGTGRLCIIDINNFPGYDGVDNFLEQLSRLLADLIVPEPADSGIDTSDSSDEKKKLSTPSKTPRKQHYRPNP
ncbi:inositol-tetrakisphosphate 1-kinase-like isoform X2 [Ornithodoros turicata]